MPVAEPGGGLGEAFRRALRRLAECKAQWLARWVRGASDARIESVMGGPLRGVLLWQIFTTMARRFDPCGEAELDAIVEFRIGRPGGGTDDHHRLVIAGGRCTTTRRGERTPTLSLELDSVSFLRLVTGDAVPAGLFLRRRLKVRGDLVLAARLPRLLDIPTPRG
jgi:putative sterol carrier protein